MRKLKITITFHNPLTDETIKEYIARAMTLDEKAGIGTKIEVEIKK